MIIMPGDVGRKPPSIRFSHSVSIDASADDPKGLFALGKALNRNARKGGIEGMVLSINKNDIINMSKTLNKWGNWLLRGTLHEYGGYLYDIVRSVDSVVLAEVFELIGKSAVDHMKLMAYKQPKERRGGAKMQHMYGKSVQDPTKYTFDVPKPRSWYVGLWEGPHIQIRTGALRKSIAYKIKYFRTKEERRRVPKKKWDRMSYDQREDLKALNEEAMEILIGPGAGSNPAPPYAWIVNEGAGPVKGMFYLPEFRKKRQGDGQTWWQGNKRKTESKEGRMVTRGSRAKSRWWYGFEGKHYLEETAQWLIRETPAMQLTAAKFGRIYVRKAIRKHKHMLLKGFGFTEQAIGVLNEKAESLIEASAKVSTKQMMFQLAAELNNYATKIEDEI
ncbi:hypothetical protein LCGC14_1203830 [marine sediment metagenome]|uniref:Uncharacterized protein n=1 Tax=marine sediment metagenome TaxID=412755 RepID=A0A0F9NYI7_9ZZZZ